MIGYRGPVLVLVVAVGMSMADGSDVRAKGFQRIHQKADRPFEIALEGRPSADIITLSTHDLVVNAVDWLRSYVRRATGAELRIVDKEMIESKGRYLVIVIAAVAMTTDPIQERTPGSQRI